jgi:uncharacterized membrane protein
MLNCIILLMSKKFLEKILKSETFWLVILILGAVGLRLYRLTAASMWVDEAWTIATVQNPLKDIFIITKYIDFHPPLYYFLLHFWIKFLGSSPGVVRLLSVLIEAGSLYCFWLLARAVGGKTIAWTAALIYTFSALMIMASQEARMYPLLNLLLLTACYNFYQALKLPKFKYWMSFSLSMTLALYTQYISLFIFLALNLAYLLLLGLKKLPLKTLLGWSLSLFSIFILYLPWVLIFLNRLSERVSQANPNPAGWLKFCWIYTLFILEAGYTILIPEPQYFYVVIFLALPALLALVALRRNPVALILLFALVLVPPAGEAAAYLLTKKQIYHPYHFTAIAAYFYLLSAAGLTLLGRTKYTLILTLPWLYFFLLYNGISTINWLWNSYYQREDWNTIVNLVQQMERPDDLILVQTAHRFYPFAYAHKGKAQALPMDNFKNMTPGIFYGKKRVWLVQNCASVMDPQGEVQALLENIGKRIFTYFEDNYRENGKMYVTLYQLK